MKRARPTSTSTASSASSHSKAGGSNHPGGLCRFCKKVLKSATATAHGSCKRRDDEAKASAAAGGGAGGGAGSFRAKSAGKKRGRAEAGKPGTAGTADTAGKAGTVGTAGKAAGRQTGSGSAGRKRAKAGKHAASTTSSASSSASVSSAASSSGKKAGKKASKLSQLQQKFKDKLKGSKFRWINEQLYTATGGVSFDLFQEQPDLFTVYHEGFRSQVEDWPVNPLDLIINRLKDQPKLVIGDFGCGEVRTPRVPCLCATPRAMGGDCRRKGLSCAACAACAAALVSEPREP
jgi:hypothetical protein